MSWRSYIAWWLFPWLSKCFLLWCLKLMMAKFFTKTEVFCQNKNQMNLTARFSPSWVNSNSIKMTIPVLGAVVFMVLSADAKDNVLDIPSVVTGSDSGAAGWKLNWNVNWNVLKCTNRPKTIPPIASMAIKKSIFHFFFTIFRIKEFCKVVEYPPRTPYFQRSN